MALVLLGGQLLDIGVARAQAPLTAAVGGLVAQNLIDRAAQRGRELIAQAERSGDALAARLGNELRVASQNAALALGAQVDKTVGALAEHHRILALELDRLLKQAERFESRAFELKDSMVLDLYDAARIVPFANSYEFLVQRFDGVTQIARDGGDYRLTVTGIGFGPDTSALRSSLRMFQLDGKQLEVRENRVGAHVSEFTLPRAALAGLFREKELHVVPITLVRSVARKGWFFWGGDKTYRVSLDLTLMPRYAGHVVVSHRRPQKAWVVIADRHGATWTSPDHHQTGRDPRWFSYDRAFRVTDNQRFAAPTFYEHSGEGCPWTRAQRVAIEDNAHDAHLYVEVQGSPCTHRWGATLEEYRNTGELEASMELDLHYGQNLVLELPPDVTYWRLVGRTATLQPIDVVGEQDAAPLQYRSTLPSESAKRVVYHVASPVL